MKNDSLLLYINTLINSIIRKKRILYCYFFKGLKLDMIGAHCKLKGSGLYMGKNICIGDFCWIESVDNYNEQSFSPIIKIGDDVVMSDFVHISAVKHISIGSGTLIGGKVYIGDHSHGNYKDPEKWNLEKEVIPVQRPLSDEKDIRIGKNCWICDGAVILAGATIGENCVIGANSVVKGTFPANSLIAGIPAKLLKNLD